MDPHDDVLAAQQLAAVNAALKGRYRLDREIGRGGMAAVYLAEDVRLGRQVAVKVMHPELATTMSAERFQREVRIAAGITHPHILALHDSGAADGFLYFVMPFIEGESLRARLARTGDFPVAEAVRLVRAIADALGCAHGLGVVHRDVKPENILLAGQHALLADFGIARSFGGEMTGPITQSGHIVGSPLYMSPEQAAGDARVDGRADLYSLACVFFELLVGAPPYRGGNVMLILARHASAPIPSVRTLRPEVSPELDALLKRALAKHPEDRFPSAHALLTALDAVEHAAADVMPARVRGLAGEPVERTAPVRRSAEPNVVNSVAVLAFEDLSSERDQEFFCDGIQEDLRAALARISGLRVASRLSSLAYTGRAADVRDIGRELDVAAVLAGTVQRRGDRVRINASLTGTNDGLQRWSETFDRVATDIFATQDEIARAVVDSLSVALSSSGHSIVAPPTRNLEAYELFLRGRLLWSRRQGGELQRAVACYRQALEIDPLYAMAYAGIADAFNTFGAYLYLPPSDAFPKAIAAAEAALKLDPTLAEAHTALGCAQAHYLWEWRAAETSFREALALNPQYSLAHAYYGLLLSANGRHERAYQSLLKAQQLDPLSTVHSSLAGFVSYYARQQERAIHHFTLAIEQDPSFRIAHSLSGFSHLALGRNERARYHFEQAKDFPPALGGLGYTLAILGDRAEAEQLLHTLAPSDGAAYRSAYSRAMVHLGLGDRDGALSALEQGAEDRDYAQSFLAVAPLFDPLRAEPRMVAVLSRMGLAQVPGAVTVP